MSILSVCGAAIVSAVLALAVKRYSSEQALLLSVGAGAVILLSVIRDIIESVSLISDMLSQSGISPEYIVILMKSLGICFLTEFSCDAVTESGMPSLCSGVMLAGKVLVLMTALPLFRDIFSTVASLLL